MEKYVKNRNMGRERERERERERGEGSMCMEKLGGRNGSSSQEDREERVYAGVKRGIVFY